MKKILLSLSLLLIAVGFMKAQINENFESGTASLNWEAPDGTWSGVVNNPKPNVVNNSTKVGRYIKKDSSAYSLFWAKFTTPINLTTNNRFKINVYSKKAGTLIFKLEGPKGNKEVSKQIVVTNAWQEYSLDFKSASAVDSLNRLILFFDAGVGNSKLDTFWFDNIQQLPADACSGVAPNLSILDDFECQRNANYFDTWDSLTVVNNPDPTGVNTSAKVGRYVDPVGAGLEWAALVHNNVTPIDLSVNNYMRLKIWAPKVGNLLLKLEDGGAAMEVSIPITAAMTNKWVSVGGDFSGAAFRGLKKAVLFFNAGTVATAGSTIGCLRKDLRLKTLKRRQK